MLLYEDENRMIVLNVLFRSKPLIINGHCLIERGSTGIWLVDTREWYDLGAIYDRKHRFQGYYCDITTPAEKTSSGYRATDLFLDLAVLPDKTCVRLDVEEFDDAVRNGTLNKALAERAKRSLEDLEGTVGEGKFHTPEVEKLLSLPETVEEMRAEVLKTRAEMLKAQGRPYEWIMAFLNPP
jgi:predicted RNA-binding protein associated with RNAse of E/G family